MAARERRRARWGLRDLSGESDPVRPWRLNPFYDKVCAEALFHEPELLSSLGLVEQFGMTGHNARLSDESLAFKGKGAARIRDELAQLHESSLDRQSASQRLSARVLDWFLQRQVEGEQFQFYNYPINQGSALVQFVVAISTQEELNNLPLKVRRLRRRPPLLSCPKFSSGSPFY